MTDPTHRLNTRRLIFGSPAAWAAVAIVFGLFAARPVLATPESAGTSLGISFEQIDAYIQQQMDRLHIPGAALAIVEGDRIVHQRGFGQAHPGGGASTS